EDGEPDRNIAGLGFHLVADAAQGTTPFKVGIGAKLFFIDATVADGGALAVGGHARYTLPAFNRFAIAGQVYYAPDVTTFGDTTKYMQFGVRMEYEILRQANVFLGYRRARAEFDFEDAMAGTPGALAGQQDVTLNSGVHFGFSILF
ncbi:MAG TPA: YfaZ family outer membrane protein, partial [Gammaproteobacteria bacterium]|nr:YfaZ family outer membrane protein [Gammaproteobacteria bacterium]